MRIAGYAATWDRPFWPRGADRPVILAPGAFSAQLASQASWTVSLLREHDASRLIGHVTALAEDDVGLKFEASLADTSDARDTGALIRSGALTHVSVGFWPLRFAADESAYRVTTAVLDEISVVRRPANLQATIGVIVAWSDDQPRLDATEAAPDRSARRAALINATRRLELLVESRAIGGHYGY